MANLTQPADESEALDLDGENQPYLPYFGEKANNFDDPAVQTKEGPVQLKVVLTLLHGRSIGMTRTGDVLALVDHMTPGINFWGGLTSPLPRYARQVCRPELCRQLAEIAAVPLQADLAQFYQAMVGRFGETVIVTSIPKPVSSRRRRRQAGNPPAKRH